MSFDKSALYDYITQRQNSDGGFAFAAPCYGWEFPSGLPDTYYCTHMLAMLGAQVPHTAKTISYIEGLAEEYPKQSAMSDFFLFETASLLGSKLKPSPQKINKWRTDMVTRAKQSGEARGEWMSADYDASESPFQNAYASAHLLSKYANGADLEKPHLSQKADGGFGVGSPDIISTAYCIAISVLCAVEIDFEGARKFINSCSSHSGGFAICPSIRPHFVEPTYFGCWALRILGKDVPHSSLAFAESLQNGNGGFRRATAGGISSPQYSFFALSIITRFEKARPV